jgi:hypothetical protein
MQRIRQGGCMDYCLYVVPFLTTDFCFVLFWRYKRKLSEQLRNIMVETQVFQLLKGTLAILKHPLSG